MHVILGIITTERPQILIKPKPLNPINWNSGPKESWQMISFEIAVLGARFNHIAIL